MRHNANLKQGEVGVPLVGIGVGNGLTNAEVQYQYYAQTAYNYRCVHLQPTGGTSGSSRRKKYGCGRPLSRTACWGCLPTRT